MELMEAIKSIAKDGADLTEIEGLIKGNDPLSGLTSKEDAFEFIRKTPLLSQAYDKYERESNERALENFKTGKMQDTIKARELEIRAEINPSETPEQKEIRELKERLNESDKKDALAILQNELQLKATELGFDPIRAKDFAVHKDDALAKLEDYANWQTETLNTRLSVELKDKYKGNRQPKVNLSGGLTSLSDADLYAAAVSDPASKPAILAEIARRSRPNK